MFITFPPPPNFVNLRYLRLNLLKYKEIHKNVLFNCVQRGK